MNEGRQQDMLILDSEPSRCVPGSTAVWVRNREIQVCLLCLLVRAAFIVFFHVWPGFPIEYQRDFEVGHFARTIATDGTMTNPYVPDARLPSALRAPLHATVLAALLSVAGEESSLYFLLVYACWSLVSCATCLVLMRLGRYCISRQAGVLSGVLYAVFPPAIYYATNATCDATLVTLALALIVWTAVGLRERGSINSALLLGITIGVGALLIPSVLSVGVVVVFWATAVSQLAMRRRFRNLGITALVAVFVVLPWLLRNHVVFDEVVFLRSNFGMEFWGANTGSGRAYIPMDEFHLSDPNELALLQELGEPAYDAVCMERAVDWIREDPARFCLLSLKRIGVFWGKEVFYGRMAWATRVTVGIPFLLSLTGLLLAICRRRQIVPLVLPLLFYPLVYYITHAQARFRHPVEVFFLPLGGYALAELLRLLRGRICRLRHPSYTKRQLAVIRRFRSPV